MAKVRGLRGLKNWSILVVGGMPTTFLFRDIVLHFFVECNMQLIHSNISYFRNNFALARGA